MRSEPAQRIVEARKRGGHFSSVDQFHRLARLPVSSLKGLAEADAFGSLGLSRREALWQVLKLKDNELPLFDPPSSPSCLRDFVVQSAPEDREPTVSLPIMP